MNFIKIKFVGGLGNQLFQYSAARAIKGNCKIYLLDLGSYENDYLSRNFTLSFLKIKGWIYGRNHRQKLLFYLIDAISRFANTPPFHSIDEHACNFKPIGLQNSQTFISLEGYWQSELYFKNIRPLLLKELRPKCTPALPTWLNSSCTVAVHVRRTDYLVDSRYGFIGIDYYNKAFTYFKKQLPNCLFILFSDDLMWCKKSFNDSDIIFCDEPDWKSDYLQLYLISRCSHQIIANSSFSWWAAWLNTNPSKLVVRPKKPFNDVSLYHESYYPSDWVPL